MYLTSYKCQILHRILPAEQVVIRPFQKPVWSAGDWSDSSGVLDHLRAGHKTQGSWFPLYPTNNLIQRYNTAHDRPYLSSEMHVNVICQLNVWIMSLLWSRCCFRPVVSSSVAFIFETKRRVGPLISMAVGTVWATHLLCPIERYCPLYRSAGDTNTNDDIRSPCQIVISLPAACLHPHYFLPNNCW